MFWIQTTTYFWLLVSQYVVSFCASTVLTCQGQKSHQSIQSCSCYQNKQGFSKQKQVAVLFWQITRNDDRGNVPRQTIALSKVYSKRRMHAPWKSLVFSSVFMTNILKCCKTNSSKWQFKFLYSKDIHFGFYGFWTGCILTHRLLYKQSEQIELILYCRSTDFKELPPEEFLVSLEQ